MAIAGQQAKIPTGNAACRIGQLEEWKLVKKRDTDGISVILASNFVLKKLINSTFLPRLSTEKYCVYYSFLYKQNIAHPAVGLVFISNTFVTNY